MRADVVGKYIKRYKPIGEMYSSYCTLSQASFLSSVEPGLIVLLFSLKRREGYGSIQPIVFSLHDTWDHASLGIVRKLYTKAPEDMPAVHLSLHGRLVNLSKQFLRLFIFCDDLILGFLFSSVRWHFRCLITFFW